MTKVKVKCGAIVEEIVPSALKWYLAAGWKVIENRPKEVNKNDKTNSKKTTTT